jgi:hypothetical protein
MIERLRGTVNVRWSRPPPLDGAPPHIDDNLGRRIMKSLVPEPEAPDPGPPALSRRGG